MKGLSISFNLGWARKNMKELWFKWWCLCHIAILATHVNVKWCKMSLLTDILRYCIRIACRQHCCWEKAALSIDHMSKIIANTSIRSYKPMSGQATEQIEGVQPLFQSCETGLFLQARNTGMLNASTSTALRKIWNPSQRTNMPQEARELMLPTAYWII